MFHNKWIRRLVIFLGVLGPAIIGTMAGNDGGGVITYSYAGAKLGYAALFTLPIITVLYGITQEMGSRIAIVSGKGLGDVIREKFGVRIAMFVFGLILIANFGNIVTDVAALKVSSEMLGIPSIPFIIITIAFCFILVTFTKYEKSQKVFLTGMVFYLAYVFSSIKANPDWRMAISSLFIPPRSFFSKDFLITSIAILGTTITPWGQFFIQSYMKDKNVAISKLRYAKLEAYIGAFLSDFFSFFIILATAATLFVNHIPLDSGERAADAIRPFVGNLASIFFALGLTVAAIIGIIIIGLTSAYAFSEFFGFTGSLDDPYKKGHIFYLNFLLNIGAAAILIITPFFPLFAIVIFTQSLNGVLLPVFFYFLLKVINDKKIMGNHTNGKLYNIFSIGSIIFIAVAAVSAAILSILGV